MNAARADALYEQFRGNCRFSISESTVGAVQLTESGIARRTEPDRPAAIPPFAVMSFSLIGNNGSTKTERLCHNSCREQKLKILEKTVKISIGRFSCALRLYSPYRLYLVGNCARVASNYHFANVAKIAQRQSNNILM